MAAGEAQKIGRLLNPLAFHIQKLGLELKCPLCLNLLTKPTLLPCDHIFCKFCVPSSTQVQCECPVCKHRYVDQEIREMSHMESMISIFRSLDATFNAKVFQFQSPADAGRSLEQSPVSVNADKSRNEKSAKDVLTSNDLNKEINRNNAEEIDLNQLQQQSPGSAHSSDSNKDFKETSELRDIKSNSAKRLVGDSSDVVPFLKKEEDGSDMVEGLVHHTVMHDNVFHERDMKRQKKLSYGLPEMASHSHDHNNQQRESCSRIIVNSEHNLTHKLSESSIVDYPKEVSDQHLLGGSVCAFCHQSKITEETGPMLHYANGREVVGDAASLSKAIPVHMKCIDWAPQVYYDGDTLKNLEAELARASKLKCSVCGLKGAALGCLMKSCRRSYHMPCAFEQDCRWDCDNFVMLCPSHKSVKFPSEKSKSRKRASTEASPKPAPVTSERLNFWATSSDGPKEWFLCGSALSSEDKYMMVKFASMCGATVCKSWNPSVTHVIAATDEKGACTRTLKVLMAILSGKWILTIDWIKACIRENYPVNEEPYEVSLDNHGCLGGPKAGRLRASSSEPKLFDGLKFYLSGEYVPAYKNDLLDLVEKAGGSIIHTKEQLISLTGTMMQATSSACLVVYNTDPPHGCAFEESSNVLLQRLAKAEELAKPIGCQVIQHTWILESIATCKLVPFC